MLALIYLIAQFSASVIMNINALTERPCAKITIAFGDRDIFSSKCLRVFTGQFYI